MRNNVTAATSVTKHQKYIKMIKKWEDLTEEEKKEAVEWWELKARIGDEGRIYTCYVEDRKFYNLIFK